MVYVGKRTLVLVIGDKIQRVRPNEEVKVENIDVFTGKHGNKLFKEKEVKVKAK